MQEDIINSALKKKDTLALMPTGGGKSICFQVPAMATDGLCLVVFENGEICQGDAHFFRQLVQGHFSFCHHNI